MRGFGQIIYFLTTYRGRAEHDSLKNEEVQQKRPHLSRNYLFTFMDLDIDMGIFIIPTHIIILINTHTATRNT